MNILDAIFNTMREKGIGISMSSSQELISFLQNKEKQEELRRALLQALKKPITEKQEKFGKTLEEALQEPYTIQTMPLEGSPLAPLNEDEIWAIRKGFLVVGGETSHGKTSFASFLCSCILERDPTAGVLFYSLDDAVNFSAKRILSQLRRENMIKKGKQEEMVFLSEEEKKISKRILLFNSFSFERIENDFLELEKNFQESPLKNPIIVIDYLQLVKLGEGESRREELNRVVSLLKDLQKEKNLLIICLSQYSRGKKYEGYRYRETSEIENVADVCIDLERPDEEKAKKYGLTWDENLTLVKISKNKIGRKNLIFHSRIQKDFTFEELRPLTNILMTNVKNEKSQEGEKPPQYEA